MDEFWHGTRLGITCAPVRQLLIDYLHEHQLRSDHASIRGLAYTLGTLFWRDLEIHEPASAPSSSPPAASSPPARVGEQEQAADARIED